ncbi:RNA polymerase I-specific transcription initiation factor RRN3 [Onthophagus taurus]|uniref:RNA polymerase I-specific transcription initiation factor RRN3 n=1 Tax=Onthophagus taurus TaxID=166361 RepID=UPI000C20EBEF|nr:RNA polymerase I-specific transcription initiation factor RRN3 [Onthophagus taurus]
MSILDGSVRSSRVSILKAPSLRSSLVKSAPKVRFKLPDSKKIECILHEFANGTNTRDYENLVVLIRDAELLDDDIFDLLTEATQCISLLSHELRLFVEAVLSLRWTHYSSNVTGIYKSFLLNLLSAHNYHVKYAVNKLVSNFIPETNDEWICGIPNDSDLQKCVHIHWVLNILIKVVPMSQEVILNAFRSHFPYHKKSTHVHEFYIHNLLLVLEYQPEFRLEILTLIFSKLVILDVNAPKDEIEKAKCDFIADNSAIQMGGEDFEDKIHHTIGHTLDVCIDRIFNYFVSECEDRRNGNLDWDKLKLLYRDVISIFDKIILPTHNIHHIQFIIFYLCCFKTAISEAFLNYLWKKVCSPSIASVVRQSAVCYIASFIARSNFIPLSMLKGTLQQMSTWAHSYISTLDEVECVNFDVRTHSVFYSVCQAIFYVIAFRQKDLFNTKKNLSFLETLNLAKIVTCRLNPLRVCQPAVVKNFAAVTRTYQLAYCYSVIEHNSRNIMKTIYHDDKGSTLTTDNILDSFFPFDPYVLKRSGEKIRHIYLHYRDNEEVPSQRQEMDVDDDFLCEQETSKHLLKFSYSCSPGFRVTQ